jgi:hypothetical protein
MHGYSDRQDYSESGPGACKVWMRLGGGLEEYRELRNRDTVDDTLETAFICRNEDTVTSHSPEHVQHTNALGNSTKRTFEMQRSSDVDMTQFRQPVVWQFRWQFGGRVAFEALEHRERVCWLCLSNSVAVTCTSEWGKVSTLNV